MYAPSTEANAENRQEMAGRAVCAVSDFFCFLFLSFSSYIYPTRAEKTVVIRPRKINNRSHIATYNMFQSRYMSLKDAFWGRG